LVQSARADAGSFDVAEGDGEQALRRARFARAMDGKADPRRSSERAWTRRSEALICVRAAKRVDLRAAAHVDAARGMRAVCCSGNVPPVRTRLGRMDPRWRAC